MESWPPHWFCTAIWRPFHRERCSVIPSFRRESVSVFTFWRVTRLVPLAVSIVNIEDSAASGLCFFSCLFVECHVDKGERRPAERGEQRGNDYYYFYLSGSFILNNACEKLGVRSSTVLLSLRENNVNTECHANVVS